MQSVLHFTGAETGRNGLARKLINVLPLLAKLYKVFGVWYRSKCLHE